MKPILVLNDVHLGVQRMAGTTPASQVELQDYLQGVFVETINNHKDKDLLIAGDLFDGFSVDVNTVLVCYLNLSNWLTRTGNKLILMAGNHDIGKRSDRLSSFDLLANLLADRFYEQVEVVRDELFTHEGVVHVIPHCMNQDLFNMELEKALKLPNGFLILHANVDNGFAENSDHSLNVDAEWLTRLSKKHTILFAHEHQHRQVNYGYKQVFVMGNQWPSSISDCLAHGEAQKNGRKFAHVLHALSDDLTVETIQTWYRDQDYVQMDWTNLQDTTARFIRITGQASATQASDVISAVAKYRQNSPAFVVSNGVVIESVAGLEEIGEVNFEKIKSFDVLSALMELLDEKEQETVKELLDGS